MNAHRNIAAGAVATFIAAGLLAAATSADAATNPEIAALRAELKLVRAEGRKEKETAQIVLLREKIAAEKAKIEAAKAAAGGK